MKEAENAGVTRVAEITGLDRIGFPVWQAVRPAGRAQSVHQGKGCSALEAKTGALGEALESHWAERVTADGSKARWEDLPSDNRYPDAHDCYSDERDYADPGEISWCAAADLRSGRSIYLPHLFVSLDCTLPTGTVFERSSAGLAVGTSEAEAVETGLLELIERDTIGWWRKIPAMEKAAHRLDMRSIPFTWFEHWARKIRDAGASLRVFGLQAIEETPVCIAYLSGMEAFGPSQRVFMGTAAHGTPEIALFKALAEALQSRLTFISGARDDMLPSLYRPMSPGSLLGSGGFSRARKSFDCLVGTCSDRIRIAERLAALGYDLVVVKRLDAAGSRIPVVKVFVPGLGSLHRSRRNHR